MYLQHQKREAICYVINVDKELEEKIWKIHTEKCNVCIEGMQCQH